MIGRIRLIARAGVFQVVPAYRFDKGSMKMYLLPEKIPLRDMQPARQFHCAGYAQGLQDFFTGFF